MSRWAAVLAGGSGTRFWPVSTPRRPKQLLALTGQRPLLAEAVGRLAGLIPAERVLVLTNRELVDDVRALLPDVPAENVLGEPKAAGTAPALAWATVTAVQRDPGASVLSLHADWHVGDDDGFRAGARRALEVAETADVLVTVGVVPTRPDPGYGYVVPGDALSGDARHVRRFVEKPDASNAAALLAEGALWNSGLFAWTGERFLAETRLVAPEIAPHLDRLAGGDLDGFFDAVAPIAVDVSHFERSHRVAVVTGRFPWDDVGNWAALPRVRRRDPHGTVAVGDVTAFDSHDCVLWSEEGALVVDGVRDLVVVRTAGVTLVTTRERAANLKPLLEALPPSLRESTS